MRGHLGLRIAQVIPTLLLVSILVFCLQQLMPGDPALVLAGEERDRVWRAVVLAGVPGVAKYERKAGRTIPVALLRPVEVSDAG